MDVNSFQDSNFLDDTVLNSRLFQDRRVVVVSIVGKESIEHPKTECINLMLQRCAFVDSFKVPDASTKIDVYFAADIFTVFLCLKGYGDVNHLENLFRSNTDKKGFFDILAPVEEEYTKSLVFLMMVSHILLFVEPFCRFDLAVSRALRRANELRLLCSKEVCTRLSEIPKFCRYWAEEGRVARPRLLFALYRHPLKSDIGSVKKKDLIFKLEQNIENQIFNILKSSRVIGNPKKRNNGVSIRSQEYPFVHIFANNDTIKDRIRELVVTMFEDAEDTDNKEHHDKGRVRFARFLEDNIEEVRNDKDRTAFYEVPKMKRFLVGAKVIHKLLFEENIIAKEKLNEILNVELLFSKRLLLFFSMGDSYLSQAKAVYLATEPRELEKNKNVVYNRKQHEFKVKISRAYERLEGLYHGSDFEKAKEELRLQCEEIWAGKKACEFISLTGNPCILPAHFSPTDLDVPASRRTLHSSSARFLSTCNCGRSQSIRKDPFTLKEANYDFYAQSVFGCCHNAECYEFSVFDKTSTLTNTVASEAPLSQEPDVAFPPLKSQSENISQEPSEDHIEILLDRNNRYRQDGSQDEGELVQEEARFSEEGSMLMSGEDLNSGASGVSDDRNSDEEVEYEKANEETLKTVETEFGKAHMDEYASSGEENESAIGEPRTSYLDDDDVQMRDGEISMDERSRTAAVEFEEEVARLRMTFRGQFLECLPNSEITSCLPLFPSWSLICLGSSSIYSHKFGLRDAPNFKNGTQFLLPLDFYLNVDIEKWEADMKEIMSESISYRSRRHMRGSNGREKVKLFVGFEYECPRGHRFMVRDAQTPVNGPISSKDSGSVLLRSELPIWMPCTCRRAPKVNAQLMRLHVVTPKAPVAVIVNPRIQPSSKDTIFHTGEDPIRLEWARYYVLRFPYIYSGLQGPIYVPDNPTVIGKLLPNCISVEYTPLHQRN
uniref:Nonsense-mediated mRNA decay factor SMG8 n=1 Tax=Syphacia muris TaxID=451379 RepID=A0A0N5AGC3_9BILA